VIPLLVALGGGLGAVARWAVASWFPKTDHGFPVGITIVNMVGSFLLGLVVGFAATNDVGIATEPLTIGILGGFTTFSTWMVDIDTAPDRRMRWMVALVPTILGLLTAAAGLALASSL
jgi:CrcB protein